MGIVPAMKRNPYKIIAFSMATVVILVAVWRYPEAATAAIAPAFELISSIIGDAQ